MKTLIVEDDFISRKLLATLLGHYGECDVAVDGVEGVREFENAFNNNEKYDLICMDIMMPNLDGQEALKKIRAIESENNIDTSKEVKVIITTALDDPLNVVEALFKGGAASYIVKPIDKKKLLQEVRNFGLLD